MWGNQLVRQWWIHRHIEVNVPRLIVTELEGFGSRMAYRNLESLQDAGFPYTKSGKAVLIVGLMKRSGTKTGSLLSIQLYPNYGILYHRILRWAL